MQPEVTKVFLESNAYDINKDLTNGDFVEVSEKAMLKRIEI